MFRIGIFRKTEVDWRSQGRGAETREGAPLTLSSGDDENAVEVDGVTAAQLFEYPKSHSTMHLKRWSLMSWYVNYISIFSKLLFLASLRRNEEFKRC